MKHVRILQIQRQSVYCNLRDLTMRIIIDAVSFQYRELARSDLFKVERSDCNTGSYLTVLKVYYQQVLDVL